MSRDVEYDVDMEDYFGERREYYVTGTYVLRLSVMTPEGNEYDLSGTYDNKEDAEQWIEEHNREFCCEQERDEDDRIEREEEEEREREIEAQEHRERQNVWV